MRKVELLPTRDSEASYGPVLKVTLSYLLKITLCFLHEENGLLSSEENTSEDNSPQSSENKFAVFSDSGYLLKLERLRN